MYECNLLLYNGEPSLKPRIRLTLLSNSRGGVFTFTQILALKLLERNYYQKLILLSDAPKNLLPHHPNLEINVLLPPNLTNIKNLINFIVKNNTELLHINFNSFFPIALLKKVIHKTPYVITLHGLPQPALEASLKSKFVYSVECIMVRFACRHAAAVVSVSGYVKRLLQKQYCYDSIVIHHGLDIKKLVKLDKIEAKRLLGYKETDKIILFVGSLSPSKDPLTLLKGFSLTRQAIPANLVLVGNGELSRTVKKTIIQLGLQNNVRLFDAITLQELFWCYSAADVFVLPTVNEAFGIVLLEAMGYGVPIVASDTGACSEVVGEAGLLFRQGDPSTLSSQLLRLFNDVNLQLKLSHAGYRRVKEQFTEEKVIDAYSHLFMQLLTVN